MAERGAVPADLRARLDAALPTAIDERTLTIAARERLDAVLDLIESGRGIRAAGSGLNQASAELLVADALLTDAAQSAAAAETLDTILPLLELERMSERARALDGKKGP